MKKLIFSFFLCGATMFPAFSQTYQELSERAVAAPGGKFQQTFIIRLCKIIVALPHIDIGTHQQGFLIIAFYIQHQRIVYPADYPAICRALRGTCGCGAGYETCGPGHDGLGRSY